MTEVNPGLQQILHRNPGQEPSISLTLAKLESLTRARQTVLLPFLDPGIGRQQSILLELLAQLGVELHQGAGNAEPHGTRLPIDATTVYGRENVELLPGLGQQQRTTNLRAQRVCREVTIELAVIDSNGALAWAEENACG